MVYVYQKQNQLPLALVESKYIAELVES